MPKIDLSEDQIVYLLSIIGMDRQVTIMCSHIDPEKDCHFCKVGDVSTLRDVEKILEEVRDAKD